MLVLLPRNTTLNLGLGAIWGRQVYDLHIHFDIRVFSLLTLEDKSEAVVIMYCIMCLL